MKPRPCDRPRAGEERRAIHGFRNAAAHGYLGLNMRHVWTTMQDYLPALHSVAAEELRRLDGR